MSASQVSTPRNVDTIIREGKVVTPEGIVEASVAIQDGRIVGVLSNAELVSASRVINASNKIVIPGLIDTHCHMGAGAGGTPLERTRDDFRTETEVSAHGGVTCFRTMLVSLESYKPLAEKVKPWGESESFVDFGFWAALQTEVHIQEQRDLFGMGITCFKHFYTAYKGWEGEQIGQRGCDDGMMIRSFETLAAWGPPAQGSIHCEEQDIIYVLQDRLRKSGKQGLAVWTEARPGYCEAMRADSAARIAAVTGAHIVIAHVSSGETVEVIRSWKRRGVHIYLETCPHYLALNKDMANLGVYGKVNPALKSATDSEALWAAMRDGVVDCMGTDQVAYPKKEKEGGGDIWTSLPGLNKGQEVWLSVLLTEGVQKRGIPLETVIRAASEGGAKMLGAYPRKGVIRPGADADLVIVDPNMEWTVKPETLHGTGTDWGVYLGMKLRGKPVLTMVRGQPVMENGQTVGKHGWGRFIPSGQYK